MPVARPKRCQILKVLNQLGWLVHLELGPQHRNSAVASLTTIPAEQPGTPPNWGVTFGVEDAEAIGATAAEFGGTIILDPSDAPWCDPR